MQLKEGSTLQGGKYRIIRVLGQGGKEDEYMKNILFLLLAILLSVEMAAETFCGLRWDWELCRPKGAESDEDGEGCQGHG